MTRRFDASEKENTPPQFAPSTEGGGLIVYGWLKAFVSIRLDAEDEFNSTDLTIHKISASAARATFW